MTTKAIIKEFSDLADPDQAAILQRFFKTGKGQYGEGDIFFGIKVPVLRKLAKKYNGLSFTDIHGFLCSPVHEHRFFALIQLVNNFSSSDFQGREKIFDFYMKNKKHVNNWDLVDMSAPKIPGNWLMNNDRKILYRLASSPVIWDRRISIIATFYFIKKNDFRDTLNIASILLQDNEDLIHKAVGWMLREVGKRDIETEQKFLKKNYVSMPRTMLRYAIEKFPEQLRQSYLKMSVNPSEN